MYYFHVSIFTCKDILDYRRNTKDKTKQSRRQLTNCQGFVHQYIVHQYIVISALHVHGSSLSLFYQTRRLTDLVLPTKKCSRIAHVLPMLHLLFPPLGSVTNHISQGIRFLEDSPCLCFVIRYWRQGLLVSVSPVSKECTSFHLSKTIKKKNDANIHRWRISDKN